MWLDTHLLAWSKAVFGILKVLHRPGVLPFSDIKYRLHVDTKSVQFIHNIFPTFTICIKPLKDSWIKKEIVEMILCSTVLSSSRWVARGWSFEWWKGCGLRGGAGGALWPVTWDWWGCEYVWLGGGSRCAESLEDLLLKLGEVRQGHSAVQDKGELILVAWWEKKRIRVKL